MDKSFLDRIKSLEPLLALVVAMAALLVTYFTLEAQQDSLELQHKIGTCTSRSNALQIRAQVKFQQAERLRNVSDKLLARYSDPTAVGLMFDTTTGRPKPEFFQLNGIKAQLTLMSALSVNTAIDNFKLAVTEFYEDYHRNKNGRKDYYRKRFNSAIVKNTEGIVSAFNIEIRRLNSEGLSLLNESSSACR